MVDEASPRPDGEYAIVECLGHRTLVGRASEVERFGTKMLAIEPIWQDELLPAVLIGGSSLYAFTPCSADVAFARQPRQEYNLPPSLRATLPPAALPAPVEEAAPAFAPRFLDDSLSDGADDPDIPF